MPLKTVIRDGYNGTGHLAGVSNAGELTIGGFPGVTPSFQYVDTINTAFNFFPPKSGHNLIITAIILSSNGSPIINIYEASSDTSTTPDKTLITINLTGVGSGVYIMPFPFGGFLQVTEGEFVNVTITAATIRMTLVGFYRPVK
jgi:hypothetical protein